MDAEDAALYDLAAGSPSIVSFTLTPDYPEKNAESDDDVDIVLNNADASAPPGAMQRPNALVNFKHGALAQQQRPPGASTGAAIADGSGTGNAATGDAATAGTPAAQQPTASVQPHHQRINFNAPAIFNNQNIYDVDPESLQDKPWRRPGADIADFFNYGLDEYTWRMYCARQKMVRDEFAQGPARAFMAMKQDGIMMPPMMGRSGGGPMMPPFGGMMPQGAGGPMVPGMPHAAAGVRGMMPQQVAAMGRGGGGGPSMANIPTGPRGNSGYAPDMSDRKRPLPDDDQDRARHRSTYG